MDGLSDATRQTSEHFEVEREDLSGGGRYFIRLPGGLEAEMTYRTVAEAEIAIDHTFTPPKFRGRDVALRLMERCIADARREGFRIQPICSYAVVQFRRHPNWADVLI